MHLLTFSDMFAFLNRQVFVARAFGALGIGYVFEGAHPKSAVHEPVLLVVSKLR